jgi:riboflavin synthase
MFTGLVEAIGEVVSLAPRGDGSRLTLRVPFASELQIGDSVAINGCCLTVTDPSGEEVSFDLLNETLKRTNLGALTSGGRVNLERALAANARMGGHFVQGHIDAAVDVLAFDPVGADWRLEVFLPESGLGYLVEKGSIAIDGISLTVAEVKSASFVCWIIPHTREVTNLALRTAGERVNLEYDMLAKYVERLVSVRLASERPGLGQQ